MLRCADGRVFKIKPSVTVDAAVVAWTETSAGVGELLLGLMPDEQTTGAYALQLIGRVDMGFGQRERRDLAERLRALSCASSMNLSSRSGLPYVWVQPKMVVEAVRDLIELPMKHAALFEAVGASAKPSGVILAGPPGTGKTLLARAVAGECEAHLEIVSGPELLNPYVGATEQALRDVFDRARRNIPALILFDELDGLAPSRADADAHHQRSVVAQLLALLDGLETRNGISVLATTNRPEAIDPALRRPGRFDRVVWMKRPDKRGRAAILTHYLKPLRLAPGGTSANSPLASPPQQWEPPARTSNTCVSPPPGFT